MLCVDRSIPILGATEDGNGSDKTLNNKLLTNISKHMARHGLSPGAFVYIADAAFDTEDNLDKSESTNTLFLTRLPANYNECSRVIRQAVAADDWVDIGPVAQQPSRLKRPTAQYRAYESSVELYDKTYRAIVVHSSAHDKRRHKRIDRLLKKERDQLEKNCKQATAFFCRADAQAAGCPYRVLHLAVDPGRETLNARIDVRCDAMIEAGLLNEVRDLRKRGYGPELRPLQAIG